MKGRIDSDSCFSITTVNLLSVGLMELIEESACPNDYVSERKWLLERNGNDNKLKTKMAEDGGMKATPAYTDPLSDDIKPIKNATALVSGETNKGKRVDKPKKVPMIFE